MDQTVEEIRQREQQNNQQNRVRPDGQDDLDAAIEAADSPRSGLPKPSRQQVIVLCGVATVAIALWCLRRRSSSGTRRAAGEKIETVEDRGGAPAVTIEDEETGDTYHIPANPPDELDKDEAIIRDSGIFGGEQ